MGYKLVWGVEAEDVHVQPRVLDSLVRGRFRLAGSGWCSVFGSAAGGVVVGERDMVMA